MKIIDLTHLITPRMPVFPGTEPPEIGISCTVEEHGFLEKKISMYSHTGTHIDAPAHMIDGGVTLDRFPIETFFGRACVYRHQVAEKSISINRLEQLSEQLRSSDFLLIATGWDRFWGEQTYFDDFPVLEEETARWLVQFGLKGVGVDVVSADRMDSRDFPVHITLLGNNMVIVENLKNINTITGNSCQFSCLPLKLQDADGAPVRAMAVVDYSPAI